jgi:ComF family protein
MSLLAHAQRLTRPFLDYALPPRCPACGEIVSDPLAFCAPCWQSIDFIGAPQCAACGIEIPSQSLGDEGRCGACLAEPPPFDRARAVMHYGEVGRTIAHRLKYSRRVGLSRVMAAQMQRLIQMAEGEEAILVPVPLHRWRIWSRGFNQSALIGREIARATGLRFEPGLLQRTINTPPLHSLGRAKRRQAVKGAFALSRGAAERISGKTVLLIDDIWTTGATASACARILKKADATRVEILCWTRVGDPTD